MQDLNDKKLCNASIASKLPKTDVFSWRVLFAETFLMANALAFLNHPTPLLQKNLVITAFTIFTYLFCIRSFQSFRWCRRIPRSWKPAKDKMTNRVAALQSWQSIWNTSNVAARFNQEDSLLFVVTLNKKVFKSSANWVFVNLGIISEDVTLSENNGR